MAVKPRFMCGLDPILVRMPQADFASNCEGKETKLNG
jgi:hypothetical protein